LGFEKCNGVKEEAEEGGGEGQTGKYVRYWYRLARQEFQGHAIAPGGNGKRPPGQKARPGFFLVTTVSCNPCRADRSRATSSRAVARSAKVAR